LQVRYQPEPGATVSATLYSLAGEAVGHASAAAGGAGTLLLPAGNLSGGLYVLTVEWRRQGEVWARQSCKVALARQGR
jgi:hypothetical protein